MKVYNVQSSVGISIIMNYSSSVSISGRLIDKKLAYNWITIGIYILWDKFSIKLYSKLNESNRVYIMRRLFRNCVSVN